MQERRAATGGRQIGVALVAVSLLLAIWCSYHEHGASSPVPPYELVTTKSWLALGQWPYVVIDGGSVQLQWLGLVVALVATALVVGIAWLTWRRLSLA